MLIEWPERIGDLAPSNALEIKLEIDGNVRKASIAANETWRRRLFETGIA